MQAENDPAMQSAILAACEKSCLFWINAFAWTFRQKITNENGEELPAQGDDTHVPFVTWMVQDEFVAELINGIENGHDVLCNKSRDMGATWLICAVLFWYWLFRRNVTFLCLSRKQQLVDRRGDMDSIFEKFRYMLNFLPSWMKPRFKDYTCHLENLNAGNSIEGESTNEHAGQGGRKTAIMLDEFSRVPNGEEIDLATADTTACRIFNSTPSGPGTQFTKIYKSRRAKIIELPWWRHPEKGRNAKQVLDERGRPKWINKWYEEEVKRRSKRDVAQNLDMDHGQAGDTFFPYDEIERHRAAHQSEPIDLLKIIWSKSFTEDEKRSIITSRKVERIAVIRSGPKMPWKIWVPLVDNRPPQEFSYCIGVDVSNGSGGSNSVASVLCHETGRIVAQFADANTSPEELAEIVAMAGVWFGGRTRWAFVAHENNGPGGVFGRKLVKMGYGLIYYQRVEGQKGEVRTERWGWNSNKAKKEVLLARYREALATDKVINPCRESLDETMDYIYTDGGDLLAAALREEPQGGRALHGDRVISDALTILAREELPKHTDVRVIAPPGTYAYRREQGRREREQASAWKP